MIYRLLRALVRHALRVFFRHLEVEGLERVPADGPLLLAANHPNTLLDVLLVASALDRRVGFVAKATLFQSLLFAPLLRYFGAVPVERAQDGPLDAAAREKNSAALAACEEALTRGGAVLIFPEGVSQQAPRLQRLKTGLARMALGAERRGPARVSVVPVALTYDDPETFRSRARVTFGEPIPVQPYARLAAQAEAEGGDPFAAAAALTEAVREALLAMVVHVDDATHDPLVAELDLLYGRDLVSEAGGRLAATAAIARAVNAFASSEPERVARVRELLAGYRTALDAAGVDDRVLRAPSAPRPRLSEELGFWLGAPLALWGVLNHAVYYQLPRTVVHLLRVDPTYAASVKLVSGLLGLFACWGLQTWAVAHWVGAPWAVAYAGTLPIAGLVALAWGEALYARRRAAAARRGLGILSPAVLDDLRMRRGELLRELDRARVAYLARVIEPVEVEEEPF